LNCEWDECACKVATLPHLSYCQHSSTQVST
jgi:hypothetical protein